MDSNLSNFIGKVILFRVSAAFMAEARSLLQPHENTSLLYARLIAIDGAGCWVENPRWKTIDAKTNKQSEHLAHVLIPWHSLVSVAVFPDRLFEGVPEEKEAKGIGFCANL